MVSGPCFKSESKTDPKRRWNVTEANEPCLRYTVYGPSRPICGSRVTSRRSEPGTTGSLLEGAARQFTHVLVPQLGTSGVGWVVCFVTCVVTTGDLCGAMGRLQADLRLQESASSVRTFWSLQTSQHGPVFMGVVTGSSDVRLFQPGPTRPAGDPSRPREGSWAPLLVS